MRKARIKIYGMDCPSCSSSIERIVRRYCDVDSVKCSYLEGALYAEYSTHVDFALLKEKLYRYGYRIPEDRVHIKLNGNEKSLRNEFLSSFEGALEWKDEDNGGLTLSVIRIGDTEGELIRFFEEHGMEISLGKTESGDEAVLAETQLDILRKKTVSAPCC